MAQRATVQIEVQGRVQGVGFRAHVARIATELGLTGQVWNESNGSVGAILQGTDAEKVRTALIKIHEGPGRVDRIVPTVISDAQEYVSFQIVQGLR